MAFDFGDAPDASIATTPTGYPAMLADDGARHEASGPTLGTSRDSESDGQPNSTATGDGADEGGVLFGTFVSGLDASFIVELQNASLTSNKLDGWIDFNRDGDWNDAGEQIFNNADLGTTSGSKTLTTVIPSSAQVGDTFARFRLSTAGNLTPTGAAADGEVEDYKVSIQPILKLAQWNFDQGPWNLIPAIPTPITSIEDVSGNGRSLTINSISTSDWRSPATPNPGDFYSLRLPYKGFASRNSMNFNYGETIDTISLWIKPENYSLSPAADPHFVMEFGGDNGAKIVLGSRTGGVANESISLVIGNAPTPVQITSVTNLTRPANRWTHVAFVWSAIDGRYDAYVDGDKQTVVSLSTPAHVQRISANSIRIGSRNASPGLDFKGQVDDVQLYYGSLSAGEIQSLAAAPIARWDFNDTSSTSVTPDTSGYGRDLTVFAVGSDWKEPATLNALDTHSLRFPAQGFAQHSNLDIPAEQSIKTIAFWIKPEDFSIDANADPHVVMEFGGDSGAKVVLGSWTTGVANESISLVVGNAAIPLQITSASTFSRYANQWTHIALVWSDADGQYDIYLDGKKQSVMTAASSGHVQKFSAGEFRLGSRNAAPNFHVRSQLDDVRLYSVSLSQSQIASLGANVIARWTFDETPNLTRATDVSGNDRNLTIAGNQLSDWRRALSGNPNTYIDYDPGTYALRLPTLGYAENNSLNLPPGQTIDTIAFWIKPEDGDVTETSDPRVLMEFGGDNGAKIVLGSWTNAVSNELLSIVVGNTAAPAQITYFTGGTIDDVRFTHIALIWSEVIGSYELFINGIKEQQGLSYETPSHVPPISASSVLIGRRNANPTLDLHGQLDDVRLYHGAWDESDLYYSMPG